MQDDQDYEGGIRLPDRYVAPKVRKKRVYGRERHRRLAAQGLCVNAASHGPAVAQGRCQACLDKKRASDRWGAQVQLRAQWRGELPKVGDYLAAPERPRNAYRIDEIHESTRVGAPGVTFCTFRCSRVAIKALLANLPEGTTIHAWRWSVRRRKKGPDVEP